MPRQLTAILALVYFSFGTLCLPQGNFSGMSDLPEMYRHCKTYEDRDMTPLDFITDHLVNVDGIFDSHDRGDEQKPHNPFTFHDLSQQLASDLNQSRIVLPNHTLQAEIKSGYAEPLCPSDYISQIFRPPTA